MVFNVKNPNPNMIVPPGTVLERMATYHKGKHDGFNEGVIESKKTIMKDIPSMAGQCFLHMCGLDTPKCGNRFASIECSYWKEYIRE